MRSPLTTLSVPPLGHEPVNKLLTDDVVLRPRHNDTMKGKPSRVRIERKLLESIEQSLDPGETIASFLETAVRNELAHRGERSTFVRRGLASIARSEAAGDWLPAEELIAKLEAKVAAARKRRDVRAK
jgi:hypothetical protein